MVKGIKSARLLFIFETYSAQIFPLQPPSHLNPLTNPLVHLQRWGILTSQHTYWQPARMSIFFTDRHFCLSNRSFQKHYDVNSGSFETLTVPLLELLLWQWSQCCMEVIINAPCWEWTKKVSRRASWKAVKEGNKQNCHKRFLWMRLFFLELRDCYDQKEVQMPSAKWTGMSGILLQRIPLGAKPQLNYFFEYVRGVL